MLTTLLFISVGFILIRNCHEAKEFLSKIRDDNWASIKLALIVMGAFIGACVLFIIIFVAPAVVFTKLLYLCGLI